MKKLLIFLLLISISDIFAQLDRSKPPEPAPAPEIKLSEYQSFTLANGLKVFVVENHRIPTVTFSLQLDVDPVTEGSNAGYVSFAGRLMRTGTASRTKDVLDEEVDFIGATLGTSAMGAYGSSLKKHTPKLLELMSDVIMNPMFKQEELDKLKKQTMSELAASKDEPDEIAGRIIQTLYYGAGHPYADIETEETVKNVTLDMCREYYESYFKPNVSYLAIVGDINKEEAQVLVEKYFSGWKSGVVKKFSYTAPKLPDSVRIALVDRPDAVQSTIRIGYPVQFGIGDRNQGKLTIANTILGGGAFRLFENLREKHAYTYGAYSLMAPDRLTGNFTASTEVRNSVTDSAITEILYEMKRMREEPVTEKELNKAINYNSGNFAISLEKPETVAKFALNIARYKLPADYYSEYLKNLAAITASDIKDIAQQYFHPAQSYIIVVGKAAEVAPKLQKFGSVEYYDIYGKKYDPSASTVPAGLTAKDVLDNYIKVIGGKEKLNSLKDITTLLENEDPKMPLEISIYQKAPSKMLQKVKSVVGQVTLQYDGKTAVQITSTGKHPITGDALEEMKMEADLKNILHPEKYGIKTTLQGIEKLDKGDAYRIEFEMNAGNKWTEYYDVKSGLKVRQSKSLGPQANNKSQVTEYSDYKFVDGLQYPFTLKQSMGPQTIIMKIKSIKLNSGLKDSFFKIK